MEKIFNKLKSFDEKQALRFMRIIGIISGLIAWGAVITLGEATTNGTLGLIAIVLFAIVFFGRRRISLETGWNMRPFNIAFAIGIGVGMVIYTIYSLAIGAI